MSKQRMKGLDEFRTVQVNLTDEEFSFMGRVFTSLILSKLSNEPEFKSLNDKLKKAYRFLVSRNNAIKQRRIALEQKVSKTGGE